MSEQQQNGPAHPEQLGLPLPEDVLEQLGEEIEQAGGEWHEPVEYASAVGRTMFDLPTSEDNTVTVLLPKDEISRVPSQSLVRVRSVPDDRTYLGIVVKGPFAEPDGLRGDAPIVITTAVRVGDRGTLARLATSAKRELPACDGRRRAAAGDGDHRGGARVPVDGADQTDADPVPTGGADRAARP